MASKPRHIVSNGQSLVDVSIQRYGSAEGLFLLLEENPSLGMSNVLTPGQELIYDNEKRVNIPTARLFSERQYVVNVGQAAVSCALVTSEMIDLEWDVTWNGSRWIVNSLTHVLQGLIYSGVFTEDHGVFLNGSPVGQSQANFSAIYDMWSSSRIDHGAISIMGDFGFLPDQEYDITLRIDVLTLIDGTVCLGKEFAWKAKFPNVIPSPFAFDYELPVLL